MLVAAGLVPLAVAGDEGTGRLPVSSGGWCRRGTGCLRRRPERQYPCPPAADGSHRGRYNFDPYKDLRFNLGLGKLKGSNDKVKTDYPDLDGKAYSFSNTLVDMSLVFEYNFWPYGTGRDYRGARRLVPFIFGGLGVTFVKGDQKNVFTANVPLGIGAKYKINERMNIGVDWGIHFSLNDELDGVKDPYGIKSSGLWKNQDCYSMLQVSFTYSFSAKCKTCNKEE